MPPRSAWILPRFGFFHIKPYCAANRWSPIFSQFAQQLTGWEECGKIVGGGGCGRNLNAHQQNAHWQNAHWQWRPVGFKVGGTCRNLPRMKNSAEDRSSTCERNWRICIITSEDHPYVVPRTLHENERSSACVEKSSLD